MSFVIFTRSLADRHVPCAVNTDTVLWAQEWVGRAGADPQVLLKMSDGPDIVVEGTLDEVVRKLEG